MQINHNGWGNRILFGGAAIVLSAALAACGAQSASQSTSTSASTSSSSSSTSSSSQSTQSSASAASTSSTSATTNTQTTPAEGVAATDAVNNDTASDANNYDVDEGDYSDAVVESQPEEYYAEPEVDYGADDTVHEEPAAEEVVVEAEPEQVADDCTADNIILD